jgi:hypothetical protein
MTAFFSSVSLDCSSEYPFREVENEHHRAGFHGRALRGIPSGTDVEFDC